MKGAFGVITRGFIGALPGYSGGNVLKPRLKSGGKAVAAYDRGPDRLIGVLHLAIAQCNGTIQHGDLAGLSPKAMLSATTEATGWQAQRIDDPDMFDLVFSREECRDVRQGTVRKSAMSGLRKAEIARRKVTAAEVDVQQMLSDAADPGPVQHNAPAIWGFNAIDKGGFIGAPISEAEARARQDDEDRASIEEYLSMKRAGRREAGGGNHQAFLNAT